MRAVTIVAGDTPSLTWTEVPDPVAGPDEVVIRVAASAVNRADLMQVQGHYPPPPGASDILGLECSGVIESVGSAVTGWAVGQPVCALLAGGGYAEKVAVPAVQLLPIPEGVDLIDAAGLPEVACTVWSNLVTLAGLSAGQTLLVHGGASGIGTMAIQIGRALGATVAVTASRASSLESCGALGADVLINYAEEDFVERIRTATADAGRRAGADVILDVVGAKYLARNVAALAPDGTLVVIGMMGGTKAEIDLGALLAKRGRVAATSLRGRPVIGPHSKQEVVAAVTTHLWPMIAAGTVRPVIDEVVPMPEAGLAHERMAAGGHLGKIVLQVPGQGTGS
ncbi:NAD(P)H-quinone oxidoreductase [Nakamurella leprariae]|uniref:NAD(P)H-quinone oxidoreductase n=1 Tax=Nakamurella leprariae TaxID=2803911 RepID=A0A938YE44_9ACTN|nr:NAD(P)H-quinone oxidoreductase [Nakamurella leprariae]MBM9467893.1 NAD(P)H-quinone oxidoreductase [Nakamurella leprariae]